MVKSLRFGAFLILILLSFFLFIKSNDDLLPTLPHFDDSSWLEERLTAYFKQPVYLGDTTVYWRGIFHPYLQLNDFSVTTPEGAESLHINKLMFSVDIVASFLKGKVVPSDVTVEGTKLFLKERPGGLIDINDIPILQADLHSTHSEKLDALIDMFLSNGVKSLKDVDIAWYDQQGKLLLPLNSINLLADSHWLIHRFSGTAKVWNAMPVSFDGDVYGSYLSKKMIYTNIKASLVNLDLPTNPLLQHFSKRFSVQKGALNLQLQLLAKPHHNLIFSGELQSNQLQIFDNQTKKMYPAIKIASHYRLHSKQSIWSLALAKLQLTLEDKLLPIHLMTFESIKNASFEKFRIKLDLFPIKHVITFSKNYQLLSPKLTELTLQTDPSGVIKNFVLQLENQISQPDKQISLSGDLQNVNVKPHGLFPGITNLTGKIDFNPSSGSLLVDSQNSLLNLTHVFRVPLLINNTNAQVYWVWNNKNQEWQIDVKKFSVATSDGNASGNMKILLPKDHVNPLIQSKATFAVNQLTHASQYYPFTVMPKSVLRWLDKSVKHGELKNGKFILNGRMKDFPFDNGRGKFLISADLSNGVLHYRDNWPDVSKLAASLLFEGRSMNIASLKAQILGAQVNDIAAQIKNLDRALLTVHGQLQTSKDQTIKVTQNDSPLIHETSFSALHAFDITGPLQLAIDLSLPLSNKVQEKAHYRGNVLLNHVDIKSTKTDFALRKLTGQFFFADNEAHTQSLTGELFSSPFTIKMVTSKNTDGSQLSEMNFNSSINMSDLQKYLKIKTLDALSGSTNYHANLKILHLANADCNKTDLLINSNLQGIASNLPVPVMKSKDASWPSSLLISNNGQTQALSFTLGEEISGVMNFSQSHLEKGNIHFGKQKAQMPQKNGLLVNGELAEFDWAAWKKTILTSSDVDKKLANQTQFKNIISMLSQLDVTFKTFKLGDFSFTPLKLLINKISNGISLAVASSSLKGEILIPSVYPQAPIRANIAELTIPQEQHLESQLNPADIPPLDLTIANLHYHDKFIQNIDLKVRPSGKDLLIKRLFINEPMLMIDASGNWQSVGGHSETNLVGSFDSNNLGAFLTQWHITDNVIKGQGGAKFKVNWANSPIHPEVKSLQGNMDVHFKQGRIIKLGTQVDFGMGIGRMLNLLSLQTLPRRLMGDFSDLTESGFSFDELKGSFQFRQGDVYTDNAFLDGTVGKVKIKGRIGLARKDYNLKLIINPNVTSSLPLVATLTAGPIVGAATWLADKVFSHQVKKMTEIHYNVTGTWDNPNLDNLSQKLN